MRAPAGLDHRPVGLVAVHGDLHSAAAGGDAVVAAVRAQLGQYVLELLHIVQRGGSGNIAAVEQDVAVDALCTLGVRVAQHGDQVADVGMHVAVGQQAEEVQRLAVLLGVFKQVFPRIRGKERAVQDGFVDEFRALRIDLAAAERVMADLRVAHIVVGRQADGRAVCLEPVVRAGSQQTVEIRRLGYRDCVAAAAVALADAVHDNQNNWFFHISESPPILSHLGRSTGVPLF